MAISRTSKVLLLIGGVLIVLFVIGIIVIALLAERFGRPSVENNSVLVLRLSGDLPDYTPEEPMAKLLGIPQQQSFSNVMTQLRKAKIDNRIGGVLTTHSMNSSSR